MFDLFEGFSLNATGAGEAGGVESSFRGWCDGLNASKWEPAKLAELSAWQIDQDVGAGDVAFTPPREDRGRGVVAVRSYREGDEIMKLACLWFDQVHWPHL